VTGSCRQPSPPSSIKSHLSRRKCSFTRLPSTSTAIAWLCCRCTSPVSGRRAKGFSLRDHGLIRLASFGSWLASSVSTHSTSVCCTLLPRTVKCHAREGGQFLLRGLRPRTPTGGPLAPRPPSRGDGTSQKGYPPSALPRVEECTYFWGVNTSWGINTAESKDL
jgi:hypothetical protein